jgi:spore coat protein U-like protein
MGKLVRVVVLLLLVAAPLSSAAFAGTATTTFNVTATVIKNCTISAANINFGNYDPLVANAATPLDLSSTVTVACTKGTVATVGLDAGQNAANATGATRAMTSGGGSPSYLSYEIFKDSGHTTVWGNAGAGLVSYTAASKASVALNDYGRILAGEDQPVGAYSDTVTATITF